MFRYFYKAQQRGKVIYGVQNAFSEESLKFILNLKNMRFISCRKIGAISNPVSAHQIINFSEQMHLMISSGIGAKEALEMFINGADEQFKIILIHILKDIKDGNLFSESFAKYNCFPAIIIETLAMGEQTQNLGVSFRHIQEFYEAEVSLKKKVKKIVMYPASVMVLLVVVSIGMSVFVLPKFGEIYSQFGGEMPMFTLVYIRVGKFFLSAWWMLGAAMGTVYTCFKLYGRQPENRRNFDRFWLDIPVISTVYKKVLVARFSNILALYLQSGVQIQSSLLAAARMLQNQSLFEEFYMAAEALVTGKRFYETIDNICIFPPYYKQVIYTSEVSGGIDKALARLAVNINRDANEHVDKLAARMQPIILVTMLIFILPTIASIMMPIYGLMKTIKM